jgi:PIN domain nuclease of toxin-antitoxin system
VIAGVADTHSALWYLYSNPRLSAKARAFIDDAAVAGNEIVFSPISMAEIVYLVGKRRLEVSAYHALKEALADPEYVIDEAPFTAAVIEAMWKVPRAEVPDMPDRIIAATGTYFGVPLISRDGSHQCLQCQNRLVTTFPEHSTPRPRLTSYATLISGVRAGRRAQF